MKLYVLIFSLLISSVGHAYNTFSGDTCPYNPQQSLPPQSDYDHAARMQARELEQRRAQYDGQMNQLNQDVYRLQGAIRRHFRDQWPEAMLAHMDNGFDCCAQSRTYGQNGDIVGDRMPAGELNYEAPTEVVRPQAPYVEETPAAEPLPGRTQSIRPVPQAPRPRPIQVQQPRPACNGYSASYCDDSWGPDRYQNETGRQCLHDNRFAATPAWNRMACQHQGQIDPRVCQDPRVTHAPQEAQACYQMLRQYQQLAQRKRMLANELSNMNSQIQIVSQPNRPYHPQPIGTGSESEYGHSSEVTNNNGFMNSLGQALGAFFGGAASAYVNNQMYQSQPYYRPIPGRPMIGRPGVGAPMVAGAGRLPGQTISVRPISSSPVPYYGPSVGFPYSNGGVYGRVVPGTTGSYGCSTGLNTGFNLLGTLMGQFLSRNNNRGPFAGYQQYSQFNSLYGNRMPIQPIQAFRGVPPPYRIGSIYGGALPPGPGSVMTPRQYITVPVNMNTPNMPMNYVRPITQLNNLGAQPNFLNYQPSLYRPQVPTQTPGVPGRPIGYTPVFSAVPSIYRPEYRYQRPSNSLADLLPAIMGGAAMIGNNFNQ